VWLEGLSQLKNPMISLGIEPAPFRLAAQCLNQLRFCVPLSAQNKSYLLEVPFAYFFGLAQKLQVLKDNFLAKALSIHNPSGTLSVYNQDTENPKPICLP
jgi:hypothetical protein